MIGIKFEIGCKIFFEHIAGIAPYREDEEKSEIDFYKVFMSGGFYYIVSINQHHGLMAAYDFYQYSLPNDGRSKYYELKPNK